jgi:hypothetical protein
MDQMASAVVEGKTQVKKEDIGAMAGGRAQKSRSRRRVLASASEDTAESTSEEDVAETSDTEASAESEAAETTAQ